MTQNSGSGKGLSKEKTRVRETANNILGFESGEGGGGVV
jgi:hypothetical protein